MRAKTASKGLLDTLWGLGDRLGPARHAETGGERPDASGISGVADLLTWRNRREGCGCVRVRHVLEG